MAGLSDVLRWETQQELVVLPRMHQARPLGDTEEERTIGTASGSLEAGGPAGECRHSPNQGQTKGVPGCSADLAVTGTDKVPGSCSHARNSLWIQGVSQQARDSSADLLPGSSAGEGLQEGCVDGYERFLLRARPAFDLILSLSRLPQGIESLGVEQFASRVNSRCPTGTTGKVRLKSSFRVPCDAGVQFSRFQAEDVHPGWHRLLSPPLDSSAQKRGLLARGPSPRPAPKEPRAFRLVAPGAPLAQGPERRRRRGGRASPDTKRKLAPHCHQWRGESTTVPM